MFEKIRGRLTKAAENLERCSEKPLNVLERIGVVFNLPVRRTSKVIIDGEFKNWSTFSVNPNYWNIISTGDTRHESAKGYRWGLRVLRRENRRH